MLEGILEGRREKESVDDSGRKGSDLKWTQETSKDFNQGSFKTRYAV